jgi:hypothetical protein
MRSTPVVGDKVWFGPRRLGWGLSPVSPEGWMVTLAAVAVSLVVKRSKNLPAWAPPALMAPFLALIVLKGTSPGGPRARSKFEAARTTD